VNLNWLAAQVATLGASSELQNNIRGANTAMQVLEFCTAAQIPIAAHMANLAKAKAQDIAGAGIQIEVLIFSRKGDLVGRSDGTL
jgi:cobalt-precorrin-5B (C1)-methyltransferase